LNRCTQDISILIVTYSSGIMLQYKTDSHLRKCTHTHTHIVFVRSRTHWTNLASFKTRTILRRRKIFTILSDRSPALAEASRTTEGSCMHCCNTKGRSCIAAIKRIVHALLQCTKGRSWCMQRRSRRGSVSFRIRAEEFSCKNIR
jgi:hypothetical protein